MRDSCCTVTKIKEEEEEEEEEEFSRRSLSLFCFLCPVSKPIKL
jgi:hypothetical protein